jgi:hypothetical protein
LVCCTKNNLATLLQRPPAWGGIDDWEYAWEDEEVTEDIRIPTASFNGDLYDDESSSKSSAVNGVHQATFLSTFLVDFFVNFFVNFF